MTREKLIDYINDFKFYKRELMAGWNRIDDFIHEMEDQLILHDKVDGAIMQQIVKTYYEDATNMAYRSNHEMNTLMNMFIELSSKEEES